MKSVVTKKTNISELLDAIVSKDEAIRYPNAIAVEKISKEYPLLLYPEWNYFRDLLKSKNAFHRGIAITTIANLTNLMNFSMNISCILMMLVLWFPDI